MIVHEMFIVIGRGTFSLTSSHSSQCRSSTDSIVLFLPSTTLPVAGQPYDPIRLLTQQMPSASVVCLGISRPPNQARRTLQAYPRSHLKGTQVFPMLFISMKSLPAPDNLSSRSQSTPKVVDLAGFVQGLFAECGGTEIPISMYGLSFFHIGPDLMFLVFI